MGKLLVLIKSIIKKKFLIFAYCRNCGRRVHDYFVPDEIWKEVTGIKDGSGIYCYDCFCKMADKKGLRYRFKFKCEHL